MAEEIRLDLVELKHLESIAKRPRVLSLLSSEIRNLDSKLSKAAAAPIPQPTASAEKAPASSTAPSYVRLDKFSWDQDNDNIKLKPSTDKDKDPMAGIMDLMKNMYEEGDEEMKRTIAKAWTDARSGKTADPLKGYGP